MAVRCFLQGSPERSVVQMQSDWSSAKDSLKGMQHAQVVSSISLRSLAKQGTSRTAGATEWCRHAVLANRVEKTPLTTHLPRFASNGCQQRAVLINHKTKICLENAACHQPQHLCYLPHVTKHCSETKRACSQKRVMPCFSGTRA